MAASNVSSCRCHLMQMAVAVKKILYAAEDKESALSEAQQLLSETLDSGEADPDEDNSAE